jgi:hypothetical protein
LRWDGCSGYGASVVVGQASPANAAVEKEEGGFHRWRRGTNCSSLLHLRVVSTEHSLWDNVFFSFSFSWNWKVSISLKRILEILISIQIAFRKEKKTWNNFAAIVPLIRNDWLERDAVKGGVRWSGRSGIAMPRSLAQPQWSVDFT